MSTISKNRLIVPIIAIVYSEYRKYITFISLTELYFDICPT